jgi:uncharacterized membrane-anchored protein YjiN (DUF445 family)
MIEDKNKITSLLEDGSFLVQTKHQIVDDFTNGIGSFSSKSINTYDESN